MNGAVVTKSVFGHEALVKLCGNYHFNNCLDVGSGAGTAAGLIRQLTGAHVTTLDYGNAKADILGEYQGIQFVEGEFDCIWCSHVLEHQLNVNAFLRKIHHDLAEGGVLAITVPPLKPEIVGGHVSLWNAGLLLYNLVLAGFDCSDAQVKRYGYNISVVVKKKTFEVPQLKYDNGDIKTLSAYFPAPYDCEAFNGDINEHNW